MGSKNYTERQLREIENYDTVTNYQETAQTKKQSSGNPILKARLEGIQAGERDKLYELTTKEKQNAYNEARYGKFGSKVRSFKEGFGGFVKEATSNKPKSLFGKVAQGLEGSISSGVHSVQRYEMKHRPRKRSGRRMKPMLRKMFPEHRNEVFGQSPRPQQPVQRNQYAQTAQRSSYSPPVQRSRPFDIMGGGGSNSAFGFGSLEAGSLFGGYSNAKRSTKRH